jgi:hypothetical protein
MREGGSTPMLNKTGFPHFIYEIKIQCFKKVQKKHENTIKKGSYYE